MIAIKDMKMPKSCSDCPCEQYMIGSQYWCGIFGFIINDDNGFDKRHPQCPLVEVK